MNQMGLRRIPPDQSSGSGHTFGTLRHPSIADPILSKRVCFYKSGDPQFNGLRLVINNRTFKTFDALLDNLSKKVPLAFGVRNITTPHGIHAIRSLDELEDGKSYICSDRRKVKPINLALARKKLPPWYHARPVSSRRQTVQQARFFPGRSIRKTQPAVLRTPKRLLVFCNGEPTIKQTVVLHKKITPNYESILEYISEQMQFRVVKLHTPDGKRVDGLPGLILCSGTVVAVGREPFKPANYKALKTPPARRHTRRKKSLKRKKKSLPYASDIRNFSPSSERYIVDQIHNTIAGTLYGVPSNPTNSVELESSRLLESVAETEEDNNLGDGAEGRACSLPSEDDIEKSFRVNQDGSMTVEMRVRLTIKEEETVHWTTTLTRSYVANQLSATCQSEPEPMEGICSPNSTSLDLQSSAESSNDTTSKDKTKDNNDEDPPSSSNEAFNESCNEEDEIKTQTDMMIPRRAPTPGHKQVSKKQTSVESVKSVTANGIQEDMVGSYSFREQTENGSMTEQYCMVKQSSSRPVPKPRRHGSVEQYSRNVSTFKSEGMSEVLQVGSSGEEVTETVLHIYEQQTCHDNFLANIWTPFMPASETAFGRPATSETGRLSCSNEFDPDLCRPSTASESISIWRTESMSVTSDRKSPPQKNGVSKTKTKNAQQQLQRSTKGQVKARPGEASKDKRESSSHKVMSKHVQRSTTPVKRQNKNPANAPGSQRKAKTFSSAGFIKRIYGNKSKSAKSPKSPKNRALKNGSGNGSKNSSPDDTINNTENVPSASDGYRNEEVSFETSRIVLSSSELSQPRGVLTRQTSMHMEKKTENKSCNNNPSNSTHEYVENWLEKARLNQQRENTGFGKSENKQDFTEAEEVNCFVETLKTETHQICESQPGNTQGTSVKLKIQSFENKSLSPPVEKTAGSRNVAPNHSNSINTDDSRSLLNTHTEDTKPLPINDRCPEIPFESETENKSNSVKILFQKASPSNTLSIDLPPPPSSAEIAAISNPEYFTQEGSSVASSPLYRLSSLRTETHSASVSPTSDEVLSSSPMEVQSSVQADIPSDVQESPLPRVPSIKRVPLVSNLSLERKMSLRKASLDKDTSGTDATSEVNTLSTTVNTTSDDVPLNAMCSTRTEQPITTFPEETLHTYSDLISTQSCCTSLSPASLTSEERVSSVSISSSDNVVPSSLSLKETKNLKGGSSPKTSVKKVKLMSSPSPERKPLNKKFPVEQLNSSPKLSSTQSRSSKNTLPDVGVQRRATPNASPSAGRKQKLYKPKQQKRLSPYSQSLNVVSSPTKHKSGKTLTLRNLSSDSPSEPTNKKQKKVLPTRTNGQSVKPPAELDKALMSDTPILPEADQREEHKDNSMTATQSVPQPLTTANQLNMTPVLEKVCSSIKSIRQITQSKRPSCLEKSNSLPDFSSHVASTFGSSTKTLLAFLSVMTLKEGIANLNMDELNTNNVSCAEALKMIDSLTEIANIEDSRTLKTSLSELQQSTSEQLLQSWKGFQELSERCKSRSSTANNSERELVISARPDQDGNLEESVIDELMESLDVPERLKVELASLSAGAKSEKTDEISESITKRAKLHSIEKCNNYLNQLSAEDNVNAPQDDKVNVDVRSMIKKFTHITQPDQPSTGSLYLAERCKTVDPSTKETDPQHAKTKCPREEHIPAGKQVYSKSSVQENLQSCRDEVHGENQDKPKQKTDNILTEDNTNMTGVNSSRANLEDDSCNSSSEKQDSDCSMNAPHIESSHSHKSGLDAEVQKAMIAEETSSQKDICEQSASIPNTHERNSSEEAGTADFLSPERQPEVDEAKQPSPCHYVEVNLKVNSRVSSSDSENQVTSVVKCKEMCNSSEKELQQLSMGLDGSVDDSTEASDDVDESSSEEEQPEVEFKQLQVIVEETSSGIEEEEEEDEHVYIPPQNRELTSKFNRLEALNEETEEDNVSSGEEYKTYICQQSKQHSIGGNDEKDNSYTKNDRDTKSFKFNTDDDSGNDHRSYEEHADEDRPKLRHERLSCSMDDLSYDDKESSSDEEKVDMSHTQQGAATEKQPDVVKCEITKGNEMATQSVAERVSLLEQQVADSHTWKGSTRASADRHCSQRNAPLESEEDSSSESPTSLHALCTRSAPQSSLSFSYDSSGVITTEPEGRVRSIREMFLAKSATDVQQRRASDLLENRGETSVGGGYQTHTSSEPSSGEDDSARQSITKGFVRKTIERLYGKKDAPLPDEAGERPPPAPKQRSTEHSSIFSSLQTARSKAMSELSYFNSHNPLDSLTGATRCIAFNAQVGPGDSVPTEDGRWLLRENTLIRKSISDPVGINKTFSNDPEGEKACETTDEHSPYSLFSSKSELEDKAKSLSRKCTYFSLPHCSDSDACQDDASKGSLGGDAVVEAKDDTEDGKTWAERNGKLPSVSLTDYKIKDNKVHPLTEPPPDAEVVQVQPGKGQGAVNRRLQDPDMLDFLYHFCGQHCPIL